MTKNREKTLGQSQLDYLMAHTTKVLPNNASGQGLSAATIKKLYYQGFQIIFGWLKSLEESGVNFDNDLKEQIENINTHLTSLDESSTKFSKDIEELNQITQKLLDDVEDLFRSFGWHTFSLTLNVSMLDGVISGSASPSQIKILDDYLDFVGGKILDLLLATSDSNLIFLHTRTTKGADKYSVVGLSVLDNADIVPAKIEITKSGLMYMINGSYKEVATKDTLKSYVRKEDLTYENGILTINF